MTRRMVRIALTVALLAVAPTAWAGQDQSKRPADAYPSAVASAWFDTLYDVVKTEKTAPPPASRIYGIASVALYESIVGGSMGNRSLVGQLNELGPLPAPKPEKKYHWPTVANRALATVIRGLYPTASQASMDLIDAREQEFASRFQEAVPGPDYARSAALGRDVAGAVLGWAATDGFSISNNCP